MKTNYLEEKVAKKDFLCSIIGHRYLKTKTINEHFSEYECACCGHQFTNDSQGKKIDLTSKLKEINETLFYLHMRREFINKFYFKNA